MSRGTLYVFEGDSRRRGGCGGDTCVGKLAQLLLPHSIGRAAPTAVCVTGKSGDFAPGPCGHVHELRPDCRGRHVLEERGREGRPTRQADRPAAAKALRSRRNGKRREITQRMSAVILAVG